jgi:hypothetical protein
VPREDYLAAHAALLRQDEWIIDGLVRLPPHPKGAVYCSDPDFGPGSGYERRTLLLLVRAV